MPFRDLALWPPPDAFVLALPMLHSFHRSGIVVGGRASGAAGEGGGNERWIVFRERWRGGATLSKATNVGRSVK